MASNCLPKFNAPEDCILELRPLLYHYFLWKTCAKVSKGQKGHFLKTYLEPIWRSYDLDQPELHPERYNQKDTSSSVRDVGL